MSLESQKAQAAKPNQTTRQVMVGGVPMGGGAPVVVQSMLNAPADDASANLDQIRALSDAGCEVVRMAIPRRECLDTFQTVCEASPLPVLDAAGEAGIPIRIGVNAGSLDEAISALDAPLPRKLALSSEQYVRHCEDRGFSDLVVSAKAHDVMATVATYRLLARELPHVPLHIGITEAGTAFQGIVKSACGLGILLEEGIGDTLRISLTDDPVNEIRACWTLLAALDLRRRSPELISCPTCGRCRVDLISLAKQVETRIASLRKPLKVAVMGCVVNGPGEAADADIGVACGDGVGIVFSQGKTVRKVDEADIVDALMEEIGRL